MVAQSESPRFNQAAFVALTHCLQEIFNPEQVHTYLAFIQTYPTGMWSFSYCTKGGIHPVEALDSDKSAQFAAGASVAVLQRSNSPGRFLPANVYYNDAARLTDFCLEMDRMY